MGKMTDGDLDAILKASLTADEGPDAELDAKLRVELARREASAMSLWWLPLVISVIFTFAVSFFVLVFTSLIWVQAAIILFQATATCAAVVLTIMGLRYFGLKEGAMIWQTR